MTPEERERAEQFLDNGTPLIKSWNEIFRELGMPEPTRQLLIADLADSWHEIRSEVVQLIGGIRIPLQHAIDRFQPTDVPGNVTIEWHTGFDVAHDLLEFLLHHEEESNG